MSALMTMSPMDCTSILSAMLIVSVFSCTDAFPMAFLSVYLCTAIIISRYILCPNYTSSLEFNYLVWWSALLILNCLPVSISFIYRYPPPPVGFLFSLVYIDNILHIYLIVNTIFKNFLNIFLYGCYVNIIVFSSLSNCLYCIYNSNATSPLSSSYDISAYLRHSFSPYIHPQPAIQMT